MRSRLRTVKRLEMGARVRKATLEPSNGSVEPIVVTPRERVTRTSDSVRKSSARRIRADIPGVSVTSATLELLAGTRIRNTDPPYPCRHKQIVSRADSLFFLRLEINDSGNHGMI